MQYVALIMQRLNSFYYARESRMDATSNIGHSLVSKEKAFLFWRGRNSDEFTHASQPIYLIGTIKAGIIGCSLYACLPGLRLKQTINDNSIGLTPSLRCAS